MKIKEGVIMPDQIPMRKVLIAADQIWTELGQELVITSGKEGAHSPSSLHYYGLAVDLRTRYFTEKERFTAYAKLTQALTCHHERSNTTYRPYTVILHKTHIHVEKDYLSNASNTQKILDKYASQQSLPRTQPSLSENKQNRTKTSPT